MKKIIAIITTFILTLFLVFTYLPTTALAADVTISSDGEYDISTYGSGSVITIEAGLTVTLTNTAGSTYTNLQIVCEGANTKLTIDGIKINDSSNLNTCALAFNGTGNTLTLAGSSTLVSGDYEPGIRVESGTELEILGDGSVETTGGYLGAGIGGGYSSAGGTITISGGTVTANGGVWGAGIGGGCDCDSGTITISGGTVTAKGGGDAAGIGGGKYGRCGEINITGGIVNAYSYKGIDGSGAAIGGGYNEGGGKITITGGTVTASSNGTGGSAGIGCGNGGDGTAVLISGGTVNASCSYAGAAIGGGQTSNNVSVTISGGTVTANGTGLWCTGIGSSMDSSNCKVTINGDADVTASGYTGIGVGTGSSGCTVTIGGSAQVTAKGTVYAGIGMMYSSSNCTVNISESAQVTAKGGSNGGAGIGGGMSNDGCTVNISGDANVTATGGGNGAGIGGGGGTSDSGYQDGGDGGKVTISGGTVTATGSGSGAGIGGGGYVSSSYASGGAGEITLSGGVIYAKSGDSSGMDIGAGEGSTDEGTFTISGDGIVFFNNDSFTTPTTMSHSYFSMTSADSNGEVYGYELPSGWTEASGYAVGIIIKYDANGGSGTEPNSTSEYLVDSLTFTTDNGDGLTNGGYYLSKWNTAADGSGIDCLREATYTTNASITLYAQWIKTVSNISLNVKTASVSQGDSLKLTATCTPSDTNTTLLWISSDNSVATVDQNGNVKAVGEGTATITVAADGISATCAVTVTKRSVTSVSLSYSSKSLYLGDVTTLTATVYPSDASDKDVTWTSSDTSVATVTSGVVQAVGEGACTITATADGVYDTCSVYVGRVAVTSVDLSYSTLSMYVDDQRILTADVSPSDATNSDVTWTSSDESIATVNSNGVVTAVSFGTATITATADGVSDSCSVTVNDEPDVDVEEVDFIIENSSVTVMYVGDTLQLSVAVTPSDATDTSVTWASSDTSVITVSSSGKVTAVAVGDATITVTAQGNISASYKITVKEDESETEDEDEEDEDEEETETLVIPAETAGATAEPEVIIQYEETDVYLTFDLDVSNLAEGAKYIQLPNDEVIDIEGKDVVSISILTSDLDNGSLEIVTLDADMVPLGSVTLSAGVVADSSDEDSGLPWFTVIMLIFGVAVTSIGGTLLFVRLVVSKK